MNSPTPSPVTIALKPCPFCGPLPLGFGPVIITEGTVNYVQCLCSAKSGEYASAARAVEVWNRRPSAGEDVKASPVVPVEKLEELETEFRSMHQVKGKESAAGAGFVTAMHECADRIAQLIKEAKGE